MGESQPGSMVQAGGDDGVRSADLPEAVVVGDGRTRQHLECKWRRRTKPALRRLGGGNRRDPLGWRGLV